MGAGPFTPAVELQYRVCISCSYPQIKGEGVPIPKPKRSLQQCRARVPESKGSSWLPRELPEAWSVEVAKGGPHKGGGGELRIEVSPLRWEAPCDCHACLRQPAGSLGRRPQELSLLGQAPQVGRLGVQSSRCCLQCWQGDMRTPPLPCTKMHFRLWLFCSLNISSHK